MSIARHHNEWLSLVPVSGPFLSMPVLMRVFPQGLDGHESEHFRTLRLAYEEWSDRKSDSAIHKAWIKFVLGNTLELPDEVIDEGQAVMLQATIPEHGETLRPDYIIKNPTGVENAGKPRLLVCTYPAGQNLERPVAGRHWKASPDTRMMELLHRTNSRIGLVTNGEHWMLVDAPTGETTGYISWYANLWLDENITLRAFRSLLGVRRFFSVPDEDTLEVMLAESAANQQEVTDQLGYQVRNAVEVLVQSLDRADQDRGGKLLKHITEEELYEAALTVMMRLVFLFSAEERELLPLDDPLYNENYAVSTLRAALREIADQQTEDLLERRRDAWSRLLSTFRAVYGGIQHERLNLPAYGGRLFDPDRFPFLEGRDSDTNWRDTPATPLPVNNRTVLHLLEALQVLQVKVPGGGHAEARLLSFRALDIEQIGHVYEGLLDHTAKRAPETFLGFAGGKDKEPEIPLSKLEELQANGDKELVDFLKKETGRTASPLKTALAEPCDIEHANRCKVACGSDDLWKRVHPFASLIRRDTFDRPIIIREGSVFVTEGTDRRTSGTHYTPRSLTEEIVQHTLEPLVYVGPDEGKPEKDWTLKSPAQLLDLRICDMACGSGAFLVQVCRYLSGLLVESWENIENDQSGVIRITPEGEPSEGKVGEQLIPSDSQERFVFAQRLVAGRCLYGVDKNPLAVEMAKLSLWLLTLAKNTPFEFLDHAIRCGDSLSGISDLDQLRYFDLSEQSKQKSLIVGFLKDHVEEAVALRRRILTMPASTVGEIEEQEQLLRQAEEQTERLRNAADLLIGAEFVPFEQLGLSEDDVHDDDKWGPAWLKAQKSVKQLRLLARRQAALEVDGRFSGDAVELRDFTSGWLCGQTPFHWPLEFPEVFVDGNGFDSFVGNPPFMGGSRITGSVGTEYREHLVSTIADDMRGYADLCGYFFLRCGQLVNSTGTFGLLATNTIAQGDTREVVLEALTNSHFTIFRAVTSRKWPGSASLEVAHVFLTQRDWKGTFCLNDKHADGITPHLSEPGAITGKPNILMKNKGLFSKGSDVTGLGFTMTPAEAEDLIANAPTCSDVVFPYLNGEDFNKHPAQSASRWVINFRDWPLDHQSSPRGYSGPVAADFPECLKIVEERVKPERLRNKQQGYRKYWWRFARPRLQLYRAVKDFDRVLATPQVSKFSSFAFVPTAQVISTMMVVLYFDDYATFALLQSELHDSWTRFYSSTLETRRRYIPTDCFETFPFPSSLGSLGDIGERLYVCRLNVMKDAKRGLTDTYNRFHRSDEGAADIKKLRELHAEMDNSVAAAYAWDGLDLGHGFHETKQGIRFTISETARREVLQRLLKLNHERYEEEVEQGLHDKKNKKAKKPVAGKSRRKKASTSGPSLPGFDDDEEGG